MSHTYAVLDVSCEAYQEIRRLLVEAKYPYKIEAGEAGEVIDMHGIALSEKEPAPTEVKTLPQYNDPTPGTPTKLTIACSCSSPHVDLEPTTQLMREGADCAPAVELMCNYCGAAVLIIRHTTQPDETFRKAGREPPRRDLSPAAPRLDV